MLRGYHGCFDCMVYVWPLHVAIRTMSVIAAIVWQSVGWGASLEPSSSWLSTQTSHNLLLCKWRVTISIRCTTWPHNMPHMYDVWWMSVYTWIESIQKVCTTVVHVYISNVCIHICMSSKYPVVCMMQGKSVGSPLRHIAFVCPGLRCTCFHMYVTKMTKDLGCQTLFFCCLTPFSAVYATLSLHVRFKSLDTKTQYS